MSLPTCECVAGLPPQQQLANIYCALYTLAQGGGGGVTYPLSPTLGGTGVANAAGETITLNGGFALQLTLTGATNVTLPTSGTIQVFDQSLNTSDSPQFVGLTVSGTIDGVDEILSDLFNGLAITNNGGNTLNIAGGFSLTTTGGSVFLNGPGSLTFGTSNTYTLNNSDNQDSTLNFGNSAAPGTTAPIGTPTNVYGNPAVALLAEPDAWMTVVKGITSYRVPLYNA